MKRRRRQRRREERNQDFVARPAAPTFFGTGERGRRTKSSAHEPRIVMAPKEEKPGTSRSEVEGALSDAKNVVRRPRDPNGSSSFCTSAPRDTPLY